MQTVIELHKSFAEDIKKDLKELLTKYSELKYADIGMMGSFGDHKWGTLSTEGKQLQSKIYEEYNKFSRIIDVLIHKLPEKSKKITLKCEKNIFKIIEQKSFTYIKTITEAINKSGLLLDEQVEVLNNLYNSTNMPIFVPDTNALIYNPEIEKWEFKDAKKFRIVLVPQVLSELDKLKVHYKNEAVKKKAEGIIRRIKEYRRRDRLTDGVVLKKDVSEIMAIATEPDLENTIPWLKKDNNDDVILASFIEVMRLNPNSPVILLTGDINLQNKAEFARLPFQESPEKKSKKG